MLAPSASGWLSPAQAAALLTNRSAAALQSGAYRLGAIAAAIPYDMWRLADASNSQAGPVGVGWLHSPTVYRDAAWRGATSQ